MFFVLGTQTAFSQPTSGQYGNNPTNPFTPENILKGNNNTTISNTPKDTNTTYNLLAPFGDKFKTFTSDKECAFTDYINIIFDIFIGICAVLAFVMLVVGGIQYMGSELVSSKEAAKSQATNALLGLLVAFSAWLILNTINPKLLDFCLDKNLQPATYTLTPETHEETTGVDGKVATLFNGKTLTACNPDDITKINFMGKDIEVNKAVVAELNEINKAWLFSVDPEIKNYKIDTIYGYVCKHVKNQPNKASGHSFGISLDINPIKNPYSKTGCTTDMPKAFIELFTSRGWGWGGNWSNVKDPMHFSKLSTERGGNSPCK